MLGYYFSPRERNIGHCISEYDVTFVAAIVFEHCSARDDLARVDESVA